MKQLGKGKEEEGEQAKRKERKGKGVQRVLVEVAARRGEVCPTSRGEVCPTSRRGGGLEPLLAPRPVCLDSHRVSSEPIFFDVNVRFVFVDILRTFLHPKDSKVDPQPIQLLPKSNSKLSQNHHGK